MAALILDFDAPLPRLLYWDASFLVHAIYPASRYHRNCYSFLERPSSADETLSSVSTLALDEATFALLRLRVDEDHPGRGFWDLYRHDPAVIRPYLGEMRAVIERLCVDPRVRLVGMDRADVPATLEYMGRYAFLPRDAMHLAVMTRLGIDSLVTKDHDFSRVDGLCLFTCNPNILTQR